MVQKQMVQQRILKTMTEVEVRSAWADFLVAVKEESKIPFIVIMKKAQALK
jgi:hypothetical protein